MALNASERRVVAQAFLRCFGEDFYWSGRVLRFINDVGGVSLLANVQNEVDTWAPFVNAGMDVASRALWKSELARIYNLTDTT